MLKKLFVLTFVLICPLMFGQGKPRLGIVPFTGGPSGDADTVSTLLMYDRTIAEAFTLVPVTNAVRAQVLERRFQLLNWIDSDVGADLGRHMGADFVVTGQIRRIGTYYLVILSLFDVDRYELRAGAYRVYRHLSEIPALLPDITRELVDAARTDTSALPRLAVALPVIAPDITNGQEAETLVQLLTIEIANSRRYAVLPRLVVGRAVMDRPDLNAVDAESIDRARALGKAVNAGFVLATEVRAEAKTNVIEARVFDLGNGALRGGGLTIPL